MTTDKQRLLDLSAELKTTPPPDTPELIVRVRNAAGLAEQIEIQAEMEMFEFQLSNHEIFTALLRAERDLAVETLPAWKIWSKAGGKKSSGCANLKQKKSVWSQNRPKPWLSTCPGHSSPVRYNNRTGQIA